MQGTIGGVLVLIWMPPGGARWVLVCVLCRTLCLSFTVLQLRCWSRPLSDAACLDLCSTSESIHGQVQMLERALPLGSRFWTLVEWSCSLNIFQCRLNPWKWTFVRLFAGLMLKTSKVAIISKLHSKIFNQKTYCKIESVFSLLLHS